MVDRRPLNYLGGSLCVLGGFVLGYNYGIQETVRKVISFILSLGGIFSLNSDVINRIADRFTNNFLPTDQLYYLSFLLIGGGFSLILWAAQGKKSLYICGHCDYTTASGEAFKVHYDTYHPNK